MRKKRFKRKGQVVYEHRKLIEYYKVADIFDKMDDIPVVKCTYEGKTFAIQGNRCRKLNLPDYIMPFHTNTTSPFQHTGSFDFPTSKNSDRV
jgi:hypothetical protein